MKRFNAKAIILRRVDYGEADRIITFLTQENGKLAVIARGVRKEKSKLAGGIELFSESQISIIEGKGDLDILASARLVEHFRNILSDYERVTAAYEIIKLVNDVTEDNAGSEFYDVLLGSLKALNNQDIPLVVITSWYKLNVLQLLGSEPDLMKDSEGMKLVEGKNYRYDISEGRFVHAEDGNVTTDLIKTWRLIMTQTPELLMKVQGVEQEIVKGAGLVDRVFKNTPGIP